MLQRTTYVTIRIDYEHDARYIGKDGYETEDIDAMAADCICNDVNHELRESGFRIVNVENCGVNY